ncbi:MAG: immunoglobulin-like domain-containing protein [Patescibacteria group bacterium]
MSNKIFKYSTWLVFVTVLVWSISFGSQQIIKAQAQEAGELPLEIPLLINEEKPNPDPVPVPLAMPAPTTHGAWCSALLGMMSSTAHHDNQVINIDDLGGVNLTDTVMLDDWYNTGNNDACYSRFEPSPGNFNFNQSNYQNIDWCLGLKQGITDGTGSSTGDPNFSPIFDLNDDGTINLTDVVLMAQLVGADDQAACYLHYVPPMPSWPEPDTVPPVITLLGSNPVDIYVGDSYTDAGATASDDIDGDISANIVLSGTVNTSTVGAYILTYDVSDAAGNPAVPVTRTVNVAAQPTPPPPAPSGGGGGGGYMPISIFNVQVTPGTDKATITWQTSRDSLTWMFYGLDTYLETESKDDVYKPTHKIDLTGLKPNTTYHYQLRARDSGGNTVYDTEHTFTTLTVGGLVPQVLGVKEDANACVPKIDQDIKNVKTFANGKLIRSCGPEVYLIVQGKKFHIMSWQILHDNFFGKRIYNVSQEVLASYQNFQGTVSGLKIKQ